MTYLLVSGCEIFFSGTKKACKEYYESLPNPVRMRIIKILDEEEVV